jgi:D-glycero-D-manno-heptose 1,7-bisphosphate phosphatase
MKNSNPIGLGPVPRERAVPLLALDLDGTVRHGFDELGRFVNGPEDVVIFPEAVAQMRAWKARGGRIIAVSNQGGIALGHMDFDTCAAAMMRTYELTGRLFDKMAWCRHHPQATDPEYARCWCRKPSPGLLIEAANDLARATGEMYPPYLGLFVGDRPEDEQCAKLAGFDFQWASEWRRASDARPTDLVEGKALGSATKESESK